MTDFVTKIKQVFFPFALTFFGVLATYTFLNWLIVIQLQLVEVNREIIELFLPIVVVVLALLLFMRPSINLLSYRKDKGSFGMYMLMTVAMTIPLIIAQTYLATATGKLSKLDSIYQVEKLPKTKYYTLNHFYFDKYNAGMHREIKTSGKNNQTLNFSLYCVRPIFEKAADTVKPATHYWLCNSYSDQISNNKADTEKENAFDQFIQNSESKFKYGHDDSFSFLEREGIDNNTKNYGKAASNSPLDRDGRDIFFTIHHERFEDRNGEKPKWLCIVIGGCMLGILLLLLCFKLKTPTEINAAKKEETREKALGWRKNYEMVIPHEGFYVTPWLLYINILLFAAMVFSGAGFISFSGADLVLWGSLYKPLVLNGDWWRLFTYMFLHGGIMHLANNMLSLYFVSFFLEPMLGRWRYLLVYLVCGLCAGVTSFYWHEHLNTVGASGAIFGLFGFMLALITMRVFDPSLNKIFLPIVGIFVVVNLIMGLAGGVDNAAHIGGLVSGFVIGLVLANTLQTEIEDRNPKTKS